MSPEATRSTSRSRGSAPLLVLAAVASVQLGGALAATLLPEVGVLGSVGLRLTLAAFVLVPLVRPSLRRSAQDWRVVLSYACCLALMNLAFYGSLDRLPIGVAVTIEFIGPLLLAASRSRRPVDVAAAAVAAVGVLLVSGALGAQWAQLDRVGVLLALLAGACWAGYIVTSARTGAHFDGLDGIAIAMVLAAVAVAPAGVLSAGADLLDARILATGLGVAILSSVLPYSLELVALRSLPTGVFGILLSLEPAAAALAGLVVLDQTLSPSRLAGTALVVLASGVVLGARRSSPPVTD